MMNRILPLVGFRRAKTISKSTQSLKWRGNSFWKGEEIMTVIKKELELRKESNEIQRELKEVIKQNYKATIIHNIAMVVLTAIIIVLTIFTLFNKTGRYAISGAKVGVYVLDTKTSQLWMRTASANVYLGTNENLMFEVTIDEQKPKDEQKQ